ncbi:hypothetical protein EVAR_17922_1 [Eumeta japonica]|uniref:Uncharacterized protein n=1 Tax=Eumeta variegata TaxID=151549 RepID=A0A4C1UY58_EUMVA|nr:hypothetical protein EVAR_17922_1 [Eumeta japonica]
MTSSYVIMLTLQPWGALLHTHLDLAPYDFFRLKRKLPIWMTGVPRFVFKNTGCSVGRAKIEGNENSNKTMSVRAHEFYNIKSMVVVVQRFQDFILARDDRRPAAQAPGLHTDPAGFPTLVLPVFIITIFAPQDYRLAPSGGRERRLCKLSPVL